MFVISNLVDAIQYEMKRFTELHTKAELKEGNVAHTSHLEDTAVVNSLRNPGKNFSSFLNTGSINFGRSLYNVPNSNLRKCEYRSHI